MKWLYLSLQLPGPILKFTHEHVDILSLDVAPPCVWGKEKKKGGRALSANSVQALHHQKKTHLAQTVKNYSLTFENYNHAWINLASPNCTHFYVCWLNIHGDTKQFTD